MCELYRRIGGNDPSLAILDDQEILCRTYIHGRVKHIDCCLYVYHIHAGNTCRDEQNAFIQTETLTLYDRYIFPLVERSCELNGLRKIDLCAGINPAPGYELVDLHGGRIAADLNQRHLATARSGVFTTHDAVEHLPDPIHTMKELHRCLAPQGWLRRSPPVRTAAARSKTRRTSHFGTTPAPSRTASPTAPSGSRRIA